jgi:hypothetical protein
MNDKYKEKAKAKLYTFASHTNRPTIQSLQKNMPF